MLEIFFIGGSAGVVAAVAVVLYVLLRYHRRLARAILQLEGWERAQEVRQKQWQVKQERRVNDLENRVNAQVQQVQQEWQAWTEQDATRAWQLQQQYESMYRRSTVEYMLNYLPSTDDVALPFSDSAASVHENERYRQAARLSKADLSERDLSRRYLVNADLREARLVKTNLFMADLSGADLSGANLSGADLSGANLSGANLRGAILVGANVLVADMNGTILLGANLRNVRNLTMDQLNSAICDGTTVHNAGPDVTQPRIASVSSQIMQISIPEPIASSPETPLPLLASDTPSTPSNEQVQYSDAHHHNNHDEHNGHNDSTSASSTQEEIFSVSLSSPVDDILATRRKK